jgi:hypothetical protein
VPPVPFPSDGHLIGVVYAEGWEVMVDAAHLSWALIDPAAGGPAGEWTAQRAAMRRGAWLPAATLAPLAGWLRAHAVTVGRAADQLERDVIVPALLAVGLPAAPRTDVAHLAEQFANEAGAWLATVARARRRLRMGWVAPALHSDVVVIRDGGIGTR